MTPRSVARSTLTLCLTSFAALVLTLALREAWFGFRGADLDLYANRIVAGEVFKDETLRRLRPQLDEVENTAGIRSKALESAAILELRLAEMSVAAGASFNNNPQFAQAVQVTKRALKADPLDSFLWYALFWLDKAEHGVRKENINDLDLSYATGRHEGWIAVHRNGDAVALLPQLPKELQAETLAEFRNLVRSNYIDDAVNILVGPGWPQRRALLDGLEGVPLPQLRLFDSTLLARDIRETIPGLPREIKKPWEFAPG